MTAGTDSPTKTPSRQRVAYGWLLQRLRFTLLRNAGSQFVYASQVRLLTILACSLVVWGSVYGVSWWGFDLMRRADIPPGVVGVLFDFLFLALMVLLIFSSGIILFGSLFTSPESAYLLSTPTPADQVFAYKFQSSLGFSSWAFVLLGCPVLIAHGVVRESPWTFYALLPVFFLGFTLLPGALGAAACLAVVNLLPRRRKQVLILIGAVVGGVVLLLLGRAVQEIRTKTGRDAVQGVLAQFGFASSALMPNHWMARGMTAAAQGQLDGCLLPLALIWSNGLMLYLTAAWLTKRWYRRAYNRLWTGGDQRRRYRANRLDRLAEFLVGYLDPQTRLLIVKDFRTFRRDPLQWGQIAIFAGLVALYIVNSRQFTQQDLGRPFQFGISLINLGATATLMCAYMGRFVYPMLSLEGRKFWILGLLPLKRERLLWGKFAFAATGSILVGGSLIVLGDVLLAMPWPAVLIHGLTVCVLAIGLSGLAVGLGACLPNFRESDPSKIAVGLGGTLNLILSLMFLVSVIGVMAGPYHTIQAWARVSGQEPSGGALWMVGGVGIGLVLGVVAAWIPLRLGVRALRQMEF